MSTWQRQAQGCSVSNGPWEKGKEDKQLSRFLSPLFIDFIISFKRYLHLLNCKHPQSTACFHVFWEVRRSAHMGYHFHQNKEKSNLLNGPRARQTPRIMAGFIHKALIFFSPVVSGIRYGYLLITAVHSWHSETPLDGNYTTDLLLTWMNYFMSPNRSWAEKRKKKKEGPIPTPITFSP